MQLMHTACEANDNCSDKEAELADDATLPDSSRCKLNEKFNICYYCICSGRCFKGAVLGYFDLFLF